MVMDGQRVLDSLKEEAGLCAELAELRVEQRRLIDAGEAEQLLEVLARKQRTIGRITEIEDRLKPIKTHWDECRRQYPAASRLAIGEAFRQVRSLLEDLIAKENEDAQVLAARKDQVEQEIKSFGEKRQIQSAYRAPNVRPESVLFDRMDA